MSGRGKGAGFDRIKPPERRLLERLSGPRLDDAEADAEGRAALFTAGTGQAEDRARQRARGEAAGRAEAAARAAATEPAESTSGGVLGLVVHCRRCDATSPIDVQSAVRAVLPLALVAPWRRHPVFAVCPACRHRAWLRVTSA